MLPLTSEVPLGTNCASSCASKDHRTFGECIKSQGQMVGYCRSATGGADLTKQKQWDRDIANYKKARKEGLQPSGSSREAVERAYRISDATGQPYNVNKPPVGEA